MIVFWQGLGLVMFFSIFNSRITKILTLPKISILPELDFMKHFLWDWNFWRPCSAILVVSMRFSKKGPLVAPSVNKIKNDNNKSSFFVYFYFGQKSVEVIGHVLQIMGNISNI